MCTLLRHPVTHVCIARWHLLHRSAAYSAPCHTCTAINAIQCITIHCHTCTTITCVSQSWVALRIELVCTRCCASWGACIEKLVAGLPGGGCQAVCVEDHQLGNLGLPAICHSDKCKHCAAVRAPHQLCRLLDGECPSCHQQLQCRRPHNMTTSSTCSSFHSLSAVLSEVAEVGIVGLDFQLCLSCHLHTDQVLCLRPKLSRQE